MADAAVDITHPHGVAREVSRDLLQGRSFVIFFTLLFIGGAGPLGQHPQAEPALAQACTNRTAPTLGSRRISRFTAQLSGTDVFSSHLLRARSLGSSMSARCASCAGGEQGHLLA